ncbi:hypothetical protein FVA81_24005 [Rhizobium sp. WL3]|uniref:hypothetical protein n=1 Tax=Rhizobium sp. WL3 TaxID=2603277 RepID=UPI0011C1E180|nr:hypothetical protein [Rhizobium sp. WL3]QEE47480.1 hypothetical protein FVA81_24005 [Rhizobium sp. WL3]
MGTGLQAAQLIVTIAIGGIAAVIAWRQWRTAQDKVKLDLFDRRFAVFMDVRRLVSEAYQLGKFTDPTLPNETIAKARFLFGDEIQEELGRLHALCVRVETNDPDAPSEMNTWFDQFMQDVKPYMSLGHLKS